MEEQRRQAREFSQAKNAMQREIADLQDQLEREQLARNQETSEYSYIVY